MPEKGTIDALFLVQRLPEKHRAKDKRMYMCFVDLEKAFDRVPRGMMEWPKRKKDLPAILVKAVMSLYEGAETKVSVGLGLSEEFSVKVGVPRICGRCYVQHVISGSTHDARITKKLQFI